MDSPPPLRQSGARLRPARPLLARRVRVPHERGAGGGSAPPFLDAGASPASVNRRTQWRTINTRLGGVAPSTVIPAGRPSSQLGSRQRKSSRPQTALTPRPESLGDAHNPISLIRSTGSLPPRSTVPDEETPGSNHRKTCPLSNCSVKPWSRSAVRERGSEQNRRIACDCRYLQPRPGPSHHALTEQLRPPGPKWSNGFLFKKRDIMRELQRAYR